MAGTGTSASWMPAEGDVLAGKYRIERVLGEGGMGIVFAAHHELLDQRVAIKLLLPEVARSTEAVARFLNEARAASRIQNEHVARVLDVGQLEGGGPYMVIEFLEGLDLAQVLEQRGPPPVADVVDWVMQALEAIAQAHALGVVHRDLKPSNLFLARRQDGTSQVKVLDFGISKALDAAPGAGGSRAAMTSTNAVLGSPAYMSPEQLRDSKSVDVRTDVWSMGVVIYELLTRGLPFDGDNVVALFAAIQERPPRSARELRPDVPAALDAALQRCLRADPRERFASVAELAAAIAPCGTRTSALSRERIERILPGAATRASRPDARPLVDVEGATVGADPHLAGRVQTAAPWATPRTAAVTRARRHVVVLLAALVVLLAGGLAARFVFLRPKVLSTPAAPASAAPPPATTSSPTAPPPPAEIAPPPSSTIVAAGPASAQPAASSPRRSWPATAPAAAKAKPNCNPPTYIDAAGHTQFKLECLAK
jgi:serine/threonine protein kinase